MKNIIVLSPNFSEDSLIINEASIQTKYVTKRYGSWNVPEADRQNVIAVYGEDLFTTVVADQCKFTLVKPALDWLAHIPEQYTLRTIDYDYFHNIQTVQHKFIKAVDFKFFPAGVYESVSQIQGYTTIDPNIEVFVSDVVDWTIEVRCFVKKRNLQTWSTYMYNRKINIGAQLSQEEEKAMYSFIHHFLEDTEISIPEAIVIDIGYIHNKGWAIIEANPVWSSGVYTCDPIQVIDTIVASCTAKS